MAIARLSITWLALLAAGCSSVTFGVANLAARSQHAERTVNVIYGAETRQRLDVYTPGGDRNAALNPVILFVHGGAWDAGSKDDYAFVGRALAARGYVAVLPNYRLYPEVHFPVFVDDVARAVAWCHAHVAEWGGDPARIFLMGHSAGAHIVMLIALDARYLEREGLGTGTVRGVIGLSGPYDFLPFGRGFDHAVFDFDGDLNETQPIHFARAGAPPALLLYGSRDRTVDPRNSESLAAALRAAGASVMLKRYDGKSHADTVASFSSLKRSAPPVRDDVDAFVKSFTGR